MTTPHSPLRDLISSLANLSDKELLGRVELLARSEQQATAQLVASLAEVDQRRLYRDAGYSSLFTYCTKQLHLSEHAAYRRIEAARAAGRYPLILEHLNEGAVTLTAVGLVADHLTPENHVGLLDRIRHQSKRAVELLVASLAPKPDAPPSIRRLPEASERPAPTSNDAAVSRSRAASTLPAGAELDVRHSTVGVEGDDAGPVDARSGARASGSELSTTPTPLQLAGVSDSSRHRSTIVPSAVDRYRVQMTIGGGTYAKLRRAQDLLRHVIPTGDLPTVFDRALTLLVADLERTRMASTSRPRIARGVCGDTKHTQAPSSRHIPAPVKRAVWARDQARCTFQGPGGRCSETGMLELHHRAPFARGGPSDASNLELRCRLCR